MDGRGQLAGARPGDAGPGDGHEPPRFYVETASGAVHVGGDHLGSPMNEQESPSSSGAAAGPSLSSGPARPIRRRMRMITSCLECRRRKLKCNKSNPCINCLRIGRDCLYLGPKLDEASQIRLTAMKEKVGSLERQLERDVKTTTKSQQQQRILADDVEDDLDEDRDLEATDLVALDITYDEDVDDRDDIIDLGLQIGRMRITERIGGLSRPRLSEEVRGDLIAVDATYRMESQVMLTI